MARELITSRSSMDPSTVREDFFMGRKHLVVPVVALVQSVIHASNAENPELALAKDFGKQPAAWDGRPLTMNHPNVEGFPVPANQPSVLETFQFGQIFNTEVKENKLVVEAWIDVDRVNAMQGEVKETMDRILAGNVVEVSTGFFADVDRVTGNFEGKKFAGIYRNFVPDHLAFLSEGVKGACSVAGGCGAPRTHTHKMPADTGGDMKDTGKPGCDCEDKEDCQCDKTTDKTHKKLSAGDSPTPAATAAEGEGVPPVTSSSAAPTTAEAPASEESATTKKEVPMTAEVKGAASEGTTEPAAAVVAPAPVTAPAVTEAKAPATLEEFLASAPEAFKATLTEGLRLQTEKKSELIQTLKATDRCEFSDEELNSFPTASLERLVKLAGTEKKEDAAPEGDFSARPAPTGASSGKPEVYAPMPQPLFPNKKSA